MKTAKKRCPLPFLIWLVTLWLIQSIQFQLSGGLPVRALALVKTPERAYVQIIPGSGTDHWGETWKEIHTP